MLALIFVHINCLIFGESISNNSVCLKGIFVVLEQCVLSIILCYTKVLLRLVDEVISHSKTVKYVLLDRLDKYAIQIVSVISKILTL
jgi:hypothetical protein